MNKDTERLDWIESQTNGLIWIARQSTTGRGFRLHNAYSTRTDSKLESATAREAIDKAIEHQKQAGK